MPPRPIQSPLALVVLGLLAEQPLHPYAMRTLLRDRGHDRLVELKAASLYDTVRRLDAAGLVEKQETLRDSRRPERTVYRLTREGGAALQAWVRDALRDPQRAADFPAALSFMYVLGRKDMIDALRTRTATLQQLIDSVDVGLREAMSNGVPPIFLSEENYSQTLRCAERDWLVAFTSDLESGDLTWPTGRGRRHR